MGGENSASAAELMYGNPGGDPADGGFIDSTLEQGGYGKIAREARENGDLDFAKSVDSERRALAGTFRELGLSQNAAQEISALIGDHWDRPRDAEAKKKVLDSSFERLSREWKGNYESNFQGAQELLGVIQKAAPGFISFAHHTGLSSNEDFLRILGGIAKHRKATAKK